MPLLLSFPSALEVEVGVLKVRLMNDFRTVAAPVVHSIETAPIVAFVCANCARPPQAPTSAGRQRPEIPNFGWPVPAREVLVPCTGRLQPEHVLKAFESGANIVCAVACAEDNCHYLEGSKRCSRRVDHIRSLLQAIGLGGERLLLFHLPGTAVEDMALAAGRLAPERAGESSDVLTASIREEVMRTLDRLPPNPLLQAQTAEAAWDSYQELDISDDDSEE